MNGQIYFHVTAYTSHDSQEVLVFLVYETLTDLKNSAKRVLFVQIKCKIHLNAQQITSITELVQ